MEKHLKKGGFIKALKLVEIKKRKQGNMMPPFDSGSEGSNHGEDPVVDIIQPRKDSDEESMISTENQGAFDPVILEDVESKESPKSKQSKRRSNYGSEMRMEERG